MTAGAICVPVIVPLRAPVLGQHKTCIDSNTKIELHSETEGVHIYYTVNGNRPEPFQPLTPAGKTTLKYKEPFHLAGGKRTVKAIAVSEDGIRESNVVTKQFDVDQLQVESSPRSDDGLNFVNEMAHTDNAKREVRKFADKMVTSKEAWAEVQRMRETEQMMKDMSMLGSEKLRPPTGTRFMNSRLGDASARATIGTDTSVGNLNDVTMNGHSQSEGPYRTPTRAPPDNAMQVLRRQREMDFLQCAFCSAQRPADPYARFCADCGNPVPALPQTRLPPPETGQMGTCVQCQSLVPLNTPSCLVCETPMAPQNQPQASIRLADQLVCTVCGSGNPANLRSCVTCEAALPASAKPLYATNTVAPKPRDSTCLMSCMQCGRVNNPDSRFCDWCGTKIPEAFFYNPAPPASSLVCHKCRGHNQPYARFCASCGYVLAAPPRVDVRNAGYQKNMQNQTGGRVQWQPMCVPAGGSAVCDSSTQTVGLFYPSQREITRRHTEEQEKVQQEKKMRDRQPLLTAVSPGRGYWRKQMDHICTHLKVHAQNDTEFRAMIGDARMAKIISTAVHEDGYELSLTVNFALRGTKDTFGGEKLGLSGGDYLSTYTHGRKNSIGSYVSHDSIASGLSTTRTTSRRGKRRRAVRAKKKSTSEATLTANDKKLLKELGKNGDGQIEEVQRLLDEGADASFVNKEEVPILHIAVRNKHADAIPILIQEGAAVNQKGPTGNTALHEAVSLGLEGVPIIDALLGCGASWQRKNNKGESSYDLAIHAGYDTIASRFTSNLAQNTLHKLTKPRSNHEF